MVFLDFLSQLDLGIMSDFSLLKNSEDYIELKERLSGRFSMGNLAICNEPKFFPCLTTYCFTNDLNGFSVFLKHISLDEMKKILADEGLLS